MTAIMARLAALVGGWAARVAVWLFWWLVKRTADRNLGDETGEGLRTLIVLAGATRIEKLRAIGGNRGHVGLELARCSAVALHSNRLYSMAKGASRDSALMMPDVEWTRTSSTAKQVDGAETVVWPAH